MVYNAHMANKEEWIKIRINADEKALFTAQAEEEGLSLSAWARSSLKKLARQAAPKTKKKK
jgi:uncharacterized protein (DUF1778 family)